MQQADFDAGRAILQKPDWFQRHRVAGSGVPLREARLSPNVELLIFQRAQQRRALLRTQMTYHHVAQGELSSLHYVITF